MHTLTKYGNILISSPHIINVVSSIDLNGQYMDNVHLQTIGGLNCVTEWTVLNETCVCLHGLFCYLLQTGKKMHVKIQVSH